MKRDTHISLSKVLDCISIPVLVVDSGLEIVYRNNYFDNSFKVNKATDKLVYIFDNQNYTIFQEVVNEAINTNATIRKKILFRNKEDVRTVIQIEAQSYEKDSNLVIVSLKNSSADEDSLQASIYKDSLNKINLELDQLVYKTAHDLRAPLTNLIGLISIMRNETDLDLLSTYFDLQEKSVNKMDDFIQKITTYTKNTRLPIAVQKIDFKSLIDNLLNDLMYYDKSEFVNKNVRISEDAIFYSDKERLEIILKNLLANSIKFSDKTSQKSSLDLFVQTTNEGCKIVLRDNGIGIPKSIQNRVWDMFYRGHASADGSGLGLYIVRETVNKLGGSITLQSEEGVFTEITLNLPTLKGE